VTTGQIDDCNQQGRKVAIIGKSLSTMKAAPYDDESWEIWTLYDMVHRGEVPRFTRHFELHPLDYFSERDRGDGYWEWLCGVRDKPVYLRETDEQIPAGVAYPVDEITERFGRYFTNTVSWMLALAIHEGVAEIALWGVDMAQDTEYAVQRPSCEYFIGVAVGAGIAVHVPEASDLLKTRRLYGFESDLGMRKKLAAKRAEVKVKHTAFCAQRNQAALNAAYCEGADEMLRYVERSE